MTRSWDTLQELSIRFQNIANRGEEFKKLKKEMEEHREAHKYHYRELNMAQDAMSKVLEIKKAQLRGLIEKKKGLLTNRNFVALFLKSDSGR